MFARYTVDATVDQARLVRLHCRLHIFTDVFSLTTVLCCGS
jgi:hypothetical protein